MAMPHALVQSSLKGTPPMAVMTINVGHFMMDVSEMLLKCDPDDDAKVRSCANYTLPAVVAFAVGGSLGAGAIRLWSLAPPAVLVLLAFVMDFAAEPDDGPH
jgi:uncharacterized membrane protein YoaK (UPF0700 family)